MDASSLTDLEGTNIATWMIGGFAIVLSAGRFYIRYSRYSLLADDAAHLFAVAFMIARFTLYSATIPTLQSALDGAVDSEAAELDLFRQVQGITVANSILLLCGIWAVKLAFMLLFRDLCKITRSLQIIWWSVLLFNVGTFWTCFWSALSSCGGNVKYLFNIEVCADPQFDTLVSTLLWVFFAAIVSSDLATMLLPLCMLFKVKMRASHKFAVAFAMSLSLVSIGFEVLRVQHAGLSTPDTLWANLELGVVVIVSTLPAYYSLIGRAYENLTPTSSYKRYSSSTCS